MSRDEKQSPKEAAEHEEKKDPETPVRVSINENAQDGVKNIWI